MKITIKCKLNPTEKQIKILDKTLLRCLDVMNYISNIAWKNKCFNRVALHHLTYYKVRNKFKLPADITCAVKDRVAFSYRAERKKQHIFKKAILPLNFNRTVTFKKSEIVSISTLSGRQKIPLILGNYQRKMLSKATKFCDSGLIKRKDKFYLNVTIEISDEPLREIKGIIGVDLGIKNIAVCSNGSKFAGEQIQSVRNCYQSLRSALQSKGTRSAKRHLKKMSGREKRFQKDINHQISKQIVQFAKESDSAIALEDLKNIQKTAKQRRKQRGVFHRWAFFQLRQFVSYKAQMIGIPIIMINPAYTSRKCSSCGYISRSNRQSQSIFKCKQCGFSLNADYNASINIQRAAVNQPIVSSVEAKVFSGIEVEDRNKLTTLVVNN